MYILDLYILESIVLKYSYRSDEVASKVDAAVERYRKRARKLLQKDQDRLFQAKKRAHQLDESFGNIDSHPSIFGTQPFQESDDENSEDSSEDSDDEAEESDNEMDDVDDLSQRMSQMCPNCEAKKKSKGPRGFYQTDKALNDPQLQTEARKKRLRRIKKAIKVIALHANSSRIFRCP